MSIKKYFFIMIVFLSVVNVEAKSINTYGMRSVADWQKLCTKYLPPMIVSGLVGAGTGGFVKYLERELKIADQQEFLLWLAASWYAEYTVRNSIIASIQKDFDDCNIEYKRNMMHLSSWIASWLTYMHV
jgi:hypothetical protein